MFRAGLQRVLSRLLATPTGNTQTNVQAPRMLGIAAVTIGAYMTHSTLKSYTREFTACRLDELIDGTPKSVQVGDNPENTLLIVKLKNKVFALGSTISNGYVDGIHLFDPVKLSGFNLLTGDLISAPSNDSLKRFATRVEGGQVIVTIPEEDYESVATGCPGALALPDESDSRTFVVLGGGAAGEACVEALRRDGFKGRIVLLTKGNHLPIDVTKLDKSFKAAPEEFELRKPSFYREEGIELVTTPTSSINLRKKVVVLEEGDPIKFDKLMIATGMEVSGYDNKNHASAHSSIRNVFAMHSVADYEKIKEQLGRSRSVVILKADFIGLSLANTIREEFPDKNVTIVDSDPKPLENFVGKQIAHQILDGLRAQGVAIHSGVSQSVIKEDTGVVSGVDVTIPNEFKGDQFVTLEADMVILSPEVNQNTKLVPASLLESDGKVPVDPWLRTKHPDVYAAGFIATIPNLHTDKPLNSSHWANAHDQGAHVAHNMLGHGAPFLTIPIWDAQLGVRLTFAGYEGVHDWDFTEQDNVADHTKASKITYLFQGDRPVGAAITNKPGAAIILRLALARGIFPSKKELCQGVGYLEILRRVKESNPSSFESWWL